MTRPTPHEIHQARLALENAGYAWKEDDGGQLHEHLARHAPTSLTVGSKYSPAAWDALDALHQEACDRALVALAEALREGRPLRVETLIPYPDVGIDGVASALVCAGLSTLTRTTLLRDPGTVYEQAVEVVVVAPDQPFPRANQVLAPGGVLWDTKELGLYSMFPGSASRPFPNDEQALTDPAFHQANVDFWKNHFFLATPEEAMAAHRCTMNALLEAGEHLRADECGKELARIEALLGNYANLARVGKKSAPAR